MFNTQNVRQLGMQLMDWFQWSFLTGEAWVFNIIMGILIGFPQKSITRLSLTTTTHSESIRNRPYHDQLPCNKTASWAGSSTFPFMPTYWSMKLPIPQFPQLSDSWMQESSVTVLTLVGWSPALPTHSRGWPCLSWTCSFKRNNPRLSKFASVVKTEPPCINHYINASSWTDSSVGPGLV